MGVTAVSATMEGIAGPVAVVGWGRSGRGAAHALASRGYEVVAFDQRERSDSDGEEITDVEVRVVPGDREIADAVVAMGPALVVVSPGVAPHTPVWRASLAAGLPLWGEVELAWRLQESGPHAGRPWLTVTGTNGKTTTVGMLGSMLRAAGEDALEVGNIGTPITRAVDSEAAVFAVELSSFQLATALTVSPQASVCLNVDADHLDWHGSEEAYAQAKARVYERTRLACVYPASDPRIERMVEEADVVEGARAIGTTLGAPDVSQVGIVEDALVDRAFLDNRRHEALHLASFADLAHIAGADPSPALLADALSAAALARAHGAAPDAVSQGLRDFHPAAHRRAVIGRAADLLWIDDSKATNAHAAAASLAGIRPGTAIWVAGGDAKGQDFDRLVERVAPLLRGVVLIGVDREPLRSSLARFAPSAPVVEVGAHPDWMFSVVNEAVGLSRPGDTVVLAPACASWDQFDDYGQRGDAFTGAVRRLAEQWGERT
ncbi:UDP-N-acetylmuramoyl-L-alanine--D-glutamate ligase [Schaalia naturae]|jgi:UDP-N-acetylmuramoylalanine--D-glutamate ligase|uniref:UDP-N-acetylmuramoylalanine--D-glutamate ligase n=1 Tax=Schaalia naturae TaxID=635203 RepID=A0ABW2SL27_9ACTO